MSKDFSLGLSLDISGVKRLCHTVSSKRLAVVISTPSLHVSEVEERQNRGRDTQTRGLVDPCAVLDLVTVVLSLKTRTSLTDKAVVQLPSLCSL